MKRAIPILLLFTAVLSAQTFHFLKTPSGVITAAVCDRNGKFYLTSPTGGVYSTTDDGQTWARVSLPTLVSNAAYALTLSRDGKVIAGTDGAGVRILQPSGVWTPMNSGLPVNAGTNQLPNIRALTVDSSGHLFAGTRSGNLAPVGLFTAPDTGAAWTDISASLPSKEILSLITAPDGTVWCGVDGYGVYSYNGSVWTAKNTNLSDLHPHAFAVNAAGDLWAATNVGVSVLRKGAASWTNQSIGSGAAPVVSLIVDPANGARMLAGTGITQYQSGPLQGSIYGSNDSGKTWSLLSGAVSTLRVRALAISSTGTIIAGAQGMYRSTDHGVSWNYSSTGFKDGVPSAVGGGFGISTKGTILLGSEYGMFRSTDKGATWNYANTGLRHPIVDFIFCDSLGYLFAGAHALPRHESSLNRLYRSTNDGLSWDTVKVSMTGIYSMIAQGFNNDLYVAHGFGAQPPSATLIGSSLAKSTDRGATWFDLPCYGGKGFSVGVTKRGTVLFGGETYGLFRSTDGGASWDTTIHIGPGGNMAPVAVSPRGDIFTYAYGDHRMWFSDSVADGTSYVNLVDPSFPMYTSGTNFLWSSTGRMYVGMQAVPPKSALYYTDGPYHANTVFTPIPNFAMSAGTMKWDEEGYMWLYGGGALVRSDSALTASRKLTGVADRHQSPTGFSLEQNYPNPFNPSTTIAFRVERSGEAALTIYDALGREMAQLAAGRFESGVRYERTFTADHLASGIYIARLTTGGKSSVRKMLLMK